MSNTEKYKRKEPLKLPRPNAALIEASTPKPQGIVESADGAVTARGATALLEFAKQKNMKVGPGE